MQTLTAPTNEQEYTALVSGVAVQARAHAGLLILTDADRVDFLQRMTTANVAALRPGQAALAVLTSPVARIEFVFTLLCREEEIWLLPAPGQAEAVAGKLQSQIFFMDKVKVANASQSVRRLRLMGAEAATLLPTIGMTVPTADDAFACTDGVTILRQERFDVPGYELILPAEDADELSARLVNAGAVELIDAQAYENRRIELGRPGVGAELTGEYNPLEAGLAWSVSDNKGCYTGQEIIARQITYDKVTKTLVGLRSNAPLPVGLAVTANGRTVGTVTSSGYSPALGGPLALAVVKRPFHTGESELAVGDSPASVIELPAVSNCK
ncbi:MAG: aminomethyltransferase family protein [Caldilineaceae bacterium]|nr:aminomethyltransferase family protein [Caldilineaceae bacterium]